MQCESIEDVEGIQIKYGQLMFTLFQFVTNGIYYNNYLWFN